MRIRRGRSAASAVAVLVALLSPGAALAIDAVPYLASEYKYQIVGSGMGTGFEQPGFDAAGFATGNAGFGSIDPNPDNCVLNTPEFFKTDWPANTDILVRKGFDLPPGAQHVQVGVAIDNDVQVFINGQDISGGLRQHENCARRDSFVFDVPGTVLLPGGTNLLAVRGHDRGVATYLDVNVRFDLLPVPTLSLAGGVVLSGLLLVLLARRTRA